MGNTFASDSSARIPSELRLDFEAEDRCSFRRPVALRHKQKSVYSFALHGELWGARMNALVALGTRYPMVTEGIAFTSIVLAAGFAAYYDVKLYDLKQRRRRRARLFDTARRFLFPYLLPALCIAVFAAYSFSALVIIPYFPGSEAFCKLHDPVCRASINPEANQVYSMIGVLIAATLALVYVALTVWRRFLNRPIAVY